MGRNPGIGTNWGYKEVIITRFVISMATKYIHVFIGFNKVYNTEIDKQFTCQKVIFNSILY